jgi:hypothetical protein
VEAAGPHPQRRRELLEILLERHDLLPLHVPAALRPHLILEEAARGARLHELADGALDVGRVAVAGVRVDHDGDVHRGAHAPGRVQHLGLRDEPDVGPPETRRGEGVAGEEHRVESGADRQDGAQRIVHTGQG